MSENTAKTPNGVSGREELKVTQTNNIEPYEIHGLDFGLDGRIMDGAAVKGGSDLQIVVGTPQKVYNADMPKDFPIRTGDFDPKDREDKEDIDVDKEEKVGEDPIKE